MYPFMFEFEFFYCFFMFKLIIIFIIRENCKCINILFNFFLIIDAIPVESIPPLNETANGLSETRQSFKLAHKVFRSF